MNRNLWYIILEDDVQLGFPDVGIFISDVRNGRRFYLRRNSVKLSLQRRREKNQENVDQIRSRFDNNISRLNYLNWKLE